MKIITPIRPSSFEEFEGLLLQINNRADVIEIWLDGVLDLDKFFEKFAVNRSKFNVQFLGVCKTPEEKGVFTGTASERSEILHRFLDLGGDFIDLDVTQNSETIVESFPSDRLFLSFHDFETVPVDIKSTYSMMQKFDPYLYKFAVTTNTENELDEFMQFVENFQPEKNVIFTTMGNMGMVGREKIEKIKRSWGSFFAISAELRTAIGQRVLSGF